MSKEIILKDNIILFARLGGKECVCPNPMQYRFGSFNGMEFENLAIGRAEFDIEFDYGDRTIVHTDSFGNSFIEVSGNYTNIIRVELVGGRPPIKHYP